MGKMFRKTKKNTIDQIQADTLQDKINPVDKILAKSQGTTRAPPL